MINWRGTRICMFFRNTGNTNPVNLNIAVLAPKSTGAGNVPVATEFFRGDVGTRAIDFGVTLSANEFRCRPINSDEYNILRHKRYTLAQTAPSASGWNNGTLKNFLQIKWFIKAKRQIRYSASDGNTPTEDRVSLYTGVTLWAPQVGLHKSRELLAQTLTLPCTSETPGIRGPVGRAAFKSDYGPPLPRGPQGPPSRKIPPLP